MSLVARASNAAIQEALVNLKKRNVGQKPLTNYFLQPLDDLSNLRLMESPKSVYFFHDEWDFSRLYFVTFEPNTVRDELGSIEWPPIVVLDWISREDAAPVISELMKDLGFRLHATYDRITYKQRRTERTNIELAFARASDLDAIHTLLLRVFDKYADHIMSLNELRELIDKEQVIVTKGSHSEITGIVILPIKGVTCNFNFLWNSAGSANLSRLLGNFYGLLCERGIQTGFSWVRRTRSTVLKLHQSFGWGKDGLVDYIYLR